MGYQSMVEQKNVDKMPYVPPMKPEKRNFAKMAVDFIRNCENLCYDGEEKNNLLHDVDRLCLENAIHRFVNSGSRESAFDVYFAFCEIFHPFGRSYESTRILLETLAEHEKNSSTLLMKHRDHYSHSVYVFLIGLVIYQNVPRVREAYLKKYEEIIDYSNGASKESQAACHFLKSWGMTSLFHDIGYPYEIAHQQIKRYSWSLLGLDEKGFEAPNAEYGPYVSYKNMEYMIKISEADITHIKCMEVTEKDTLNTIFARAIYERLGAGRVYGFSYEKVLDVLEQRATNSCSFMDQAYFSGITLFKRMLQAGSDITEELMDVMVAIMLHNSMFKFGLKGERNVPSKNNPDNALQLDDGMPLAYLLMLCDELQCWDRTAYGQNSRTEISPWDCDFYFDGKGIRVLYYFDEDYYDKALEAKSYNSMIDSSVVYKKDKNGNDKTYGAYKFVRDINEIISVDFEDGRLLKVNAVFATRKKRRGEYISDCTYLNIYDLAIALNARYDEKITKDLDELEVKMNAEEMVIKMEKSFNSLTLEYKLSNIAQAREFTRHIERLGCFYTDRCVDYEMLTDFTKDELKKLEEWEHTRWMKEKYDMGWQEGADYANREEREMVRRHKDLIATSQLSEEELLKDTEPMRFMIRLLAMYDGLRIYRKDVEA